MAAWVRGGTPSAERPSACAPATARPAIDGAADGRAMGANREAPTREMRALGAEVTLASASTVDASPLEDPSGRVTTGGAGSRPDGAPLTPGTGGIAGAFTDGFETATGAFAGGSVGLTVGVFTGTVGVFTGTVGVFTGTVGVFTGHTSVFSREGTVV